MLVFNDVFFHDKDKESSWNAPKPCGGYYKVYKRSLILFDPLGNRIGTVGNDVLTKVKQNKDGYDIPEIIPDYKDNQSEQKESEIAAAMSLIAAKAKKK
jgi:hypothetical protein